MDAEVSLKSIRRFLDETYGQEGGGIGDEEPLLGDLLDSIGVLTLATHLEETFGITIGAHEMDPANFGTLRALSEFVARKAETR